MVAIVGNWVGMFTNTTGQGDIVLASALPGYTSFESIAGTDQEFWYAIIDGNNREAGMGRYDQGFFYRDNVYAVLVDGNYVGTAAAPLDLSGSAQIYCTFNGTAFTELWDHILNEDIHYPDAPIDGFQYARQDGDWEIVTSLGIPPGGPDAYILAKASEADFDTEWVPPSAGGGGQVDSVVGGTDITVDSSDPINPIVNFSGVIPPSGGQVDSVVGGTDITVDATDPINPIINNDAPDQIVTLTDGGATTITGTYPDFTITSTDTVGGQVDSVVSGTDITIDNTDPVNPIVNFSGETGGQVNVVQGGNAITVDPTDPVNPIVNADTFTGAGTTGVVPDPGSELEYFLQDDGTFQPAPISPIGGTALSYQWDNDTTATDPGPGYVKVNETLQDTANEMYVSAESRLGNDVSIFWENQQEGDYVGLWEEGNQGDESDYYLITGPVVDNGGWFTIPVEFRAGTGGIDNNKNVTVFFLGNPSETIPIGGTEGQVLTKASDTNFDDYWADTGDVVGPPNAVANNIPLFDGVTGQLLKNSTLNQDSFATAAQGETADSALQPGDYLSELDNDQGFIPFAGASAAEVVTALPAEPNANTLYFVVAGFPTELSINMPAGGDANLTVSVAGGSTFDTNWGDS